MDIRCVAVEDAAELSAIYAPYVEHTAVSFENIAPDAEEFRRRIEEFGSKFPYLAAVEDGKIVGYAYAHPFHTRAAYDKCVELSVYVSRSKRRSGIGAALYAELERRLRAMGIQNLYACVAYAETEDEYLTHDSVKFHERLGFAECAHLHLCGHKFGRWYDMLYLEKMIGTHRKSDV